MTEPNIRKPIGKRQRFEIFKRDGFVCQYCGAHPPAAILHLDHIKAVADGGTNDDSNLVTACQDCNLGKGARALGDVPQSLRDKAADIAEREEQLRGYHEIIEARARRINLDVSRVEEVFERLCECDFTERDRISVKRFIQALGVHSVMEAMEKACMLKHDPYPSWKYFCGICWNRIKHPEGGH